jgi:flagellar biosynthesis protein FliR
VNPAELAESWLAGAVLTAARVLPVCGLSAALSGKLVPWPVAVSLGLSLTCAFVRPVAGLAPASLVGASIRELGLGLVFAVAVLLPVAALGWAARLAEHAVPGLGLRRGSPIARLYALVAVLTFVGLSGHRAIVMGLSASLRDLPLGPLALDRTAFAFGVVAFVTDAFGFAFALAVPLLLSLWVAGALVALGARALGVGPTLDGSLRGPLWALLAGLMLAPLAARTPDAMRAGLAAARTALSHSARP